VDQYLTVICLLTPFTKDVMNFSILSFFGGKFDLPGSKFGSRSADPLFQSGSDLDPNPI
jgi:hypothetical protein